jgi:predicted acylesterase/phospholipase RssA
MGYVNTSLMLKYNPPTVLVEPNLLDLSTLDFTQAARALSIGRQAAEKTEKTLLRKIKRRL